MNQIALITGGGGGIGGAVAQRMAEAGIADVIADYDGGAAEKVKGEIVAKGGQADALAIDVTVAREIKAVVTDVAQRYGRIDILANIAGGSAYTKRLEEFTWAQWKEVIDANLKGTFLMCREVAPIMQKQKSGRIMNTASNYGVTGSALRTPYAAAKAGIITFTKSLALELRPITCCQHRRAGTDGYRGSEQESPEARQHVGAQYRLTDGVPEDWRNVFLLTTAESARSPVKHFT